MNLNKDNNMALRSVFEFKPSKGDIKRLEIVMAAIECLATIGFDKTTYESIAKLVGTRRAHVNYYFQDKNEIILTSVKYIVSNYQKVSMDHVEKGEDGLSMLLKYVEGPYLWAQKFPNELTVMMLFYYLATINDEYKDLNDQIRIAGSERISFILRNYMDFDLKTSKVLGKAIQNSITGFMIDSVTTSLTSLKQAEKKNKEMIVELIELYKGK